MKPSLSALVANRRKLTTVTIFLVAVVLLLWFVVMPLVIVFSRSFQGVGGNFSLESWKALAGAEEWDAIKNSLLLGLSVTLLSTALALPTAFLLAKTPLRKLWWIDLVLMIPFMVAPYINSMGWIFFIQRNGVLQNLCPSLSSVGEAFDSFFGMVWVMSLHTYPFLLTMLKSAFLQFPKSLEDASDIYTGSTFRKITRVYCPILLPNYAIGAFLVFVKALSEYGTPSTFGPRIGVTVFTTIITNRMQVAPIDFSTAASLASLLVLICMVLWVLQMVITAKKSYALSQGESTKISHSKALLSVGVLFLLLLFFFSTFIPIGTIIMTALKKTLGRPLDSENFTWDNFHTALSFDGQFGGGLTSVVNTLKVALISGFIILVLGLALGIFIRRNRKKNTGKTIEFLATLPQLIPNIVTGIGLIMLYSLVYNVFPIYRTWWMLVLAYTIIFLPSMLSYVKNSLQQMPDSLIEAGDIFARNRWIVDLRVILPQALKGAFYGFAMALIVALRELVTAKLLQPSGFYTVSLYINFQFEQGNRQVAMSLAVISVLVTLVILLPLEFFAMRPKKGRG